MTQGFEFDEASHTYRLEGIILPSITQVLGAVGITHDDFYDEASRVRGTAVHRACWFLTENDLDWKTVSPGIEPYVRAYERFLKESGFKAIWCEKAMAHPHLQFAGTPDLYGTWDGKDKPIVLDIKTGEPGAGAKAQTAAQAILCRDNGFPVTGRGALRLTKEGTYKVIPYDDPEDEAAFMCALTVVHYRRNHADHCGIGK
jgi:hypothetical protein